MTNTGISDSGLVVRDAGDRVRCQDAAMIGDRRSRRFGSVVAVFTAFAAMAPAAPSAGQQVVPPSASAEALQGAPTCEAPVGSFRRCVFRDADWQHTVYVENRVEIGTALALLLAVRDGRVVNAQRADSSGKVPPLPIIDVVRVFQVDGPSLWVEETGQDPSRSHQYVLRTNTASDSLRGSELWVNLRDGRVVVVAILFWIS